jgi:hypothetical protein
MPHLSCLENAWPLSCSQMNAPPVDARGRDPHEAGV